MGVIMDKIVLRNNVLGVGKINSELIRLCGTKKYKDYEALEKDYSFSYIINVLFSENVDSSDFLSSNLHKEYLECKNNNEDTSGFLQTYPISDDFCLHISNNIYLYHLVKLDNKLYPNFIPWFYADSKKYIGDSWWETDEEIIGKLQSLTLIDFLRHYKGY